MVHNNILLLASFNCLLKLFATEMKWITNTETKNYASVLSLWESC